MRRLGTTVVLACFLLGGTSSSAWAKDSKTTEGAEDAIERFFEYINNRQWGPYYAFLHPAQQALVSKEVFMACFDRGVPDGASVTDVDFIDHYKEKVTIPGTDVKAKSMALTAKITAQQGQLEDTATDTFHVFWVKNKWAWTMDSERFDDCTSIRRL